MLRFAVVHAPAGPLEGPGLYENIQTPGLESEYMYTGDLPGEWYTSYEKGDIDERQQRPKVPGTHNIKVAFDFDGTLTKDPKTFQRLIHKIVAGGGKAYLVTGRCDLDKNEVLAFCKMHRLKFHETHFYPIPYRSNWIRWDGTLEVRIGMWKAKMLKKIGVDIVIDDSPIHIRQIRKVLKNILILIPCGGIA